MHTKPNVQVRKLKNQTLNETEKQKTTGLR